MNRITRTVLTTTITAALAGTGVVVTATSASASGCTGASHTEKMTDPATGKKVEARVTDCYNNTTRDGERQSAGNRPAPGTGGLILRDSSGKDLGSGIGEGQNFKFVKCGPANSGLVYVQQTTRGTGGGWGNKYSGYVKQEFTSNPSAFTCN